MNSTASTTKKQAEGKGPLTLTEREHPLRLLS